MSSYGHCRCTNFNYICNCKCNKWYQHRPQTAQVNQPNQKTIMKTWRRHVQCRPYTESHIRAQPSPVLPAQPNRPPTEHSAPTSLSSPFFSKREPHRYTCLGKKIPVLSSKRWFNSPLCSCNSSLMRYFFCSSPIIHIMHAKQQPGLQTSF